MSDIRTPKGKLIGKLDERTGSLQIKDGIKTTLIEIPTSGLKIRFTAGNGEQEEVYIPPVARTHQVA